MVRALDGGDGKCSPIRETTSPLPAALRPRARALRHGITRQPPAPGAWETKVGRIPAGRRGIARLPRGTCTCWRDASHCDEIVREIREQFGSAAGNREVMPENAPAFA